MIAAPGPVSGNETGCGLETGVMTTGVGCGEVGVGVGVGVAGVVGVTVGGGVGFAGLGVTGFGVVGVVGVVGVIGGATGGGVGFVVGVAVTGLPQAPIIAKSKAPFVMTTNTLMVFERKTFWLVV